MNQAIESVRDKSPYKRGADDGLIMGIILIILFMASVYSYKSPLANVIAIALLLVGVPAATFLMLRRSYVKDNCLTLFSSLWMQGIVIFFCATLLLAAWVYIYLRFINPTFLIDTLNHVATLYDNMGTATGQQISATIHAMIKQNLVPSSISIAIETIWLGVFSGSLLSALMAALVRLKNRKNF